MLSQPMRSRSASALFLCAALLCARAASFGAEPAADTPASAGTPAPTDSVRHVANVTGRVLDAQTGLALAGATVTIPLLRRSAQTDRDGRFAFSDVPIGSYTLRVEHAGYDTTLSDEVLLRAGTEAVVTLALQATGSSSHLREIARTSVRASQSLQRSSIVYRELSTEQLAEAGTYRAGDALRQLPAVNNGIVGDTAALGDDLQLDIRGIGTLETTATLDGHPIAYGVPGGFNYQLSPIIGLRAIDVVYGSGSNGLRDERNRRYRRLQHDRPDAREQRITSSPKATARSTRRRRRRSATGTVGRLGYAASRRRFVRSTDRSIITFSTSRERHSTSPRPIRRFAIWRSTRTIRPPDRATAVLKLRYDLSSATSLTFDQRGQFVLEQQDRKRRRRLPELRSAARLRRAALALRREPAQAESVPERHVSAPNAYGAPNGTGPNGKPDGGIRCQTPQQYAAFNTGLAGCRAGLAIVQFQRLRT